MPTNENTGDDYRPLPIGAYVTTLEADRATIVEISLDGCTVWPVAGIGEAIRHPADTPDLGLGRTLAALRATRDLADRLAHAVAKRTLELEPEPAWVYGGSVGIHNPGFEDGDGWTRSPSLRHADQEVLLVWQPIRTASREMREWLLPRPSRLRIIDTMISVHITTGAWPTWQDVVRGHHQPTDGSEEE